MKPLGRLDHTCVGDRSLGEHAGDITPSELPLDGIQIVVLDQAYVSRRIARYAQPFRHHPVTVKLAQQFIRVAVILAVKHQHRAAPGEARATRIASVLAWVEDSVNCHDGSPKRRASSTRHRLPVPSRQQELRSRGHPVTNSPNDRLDTVAREHARVREVEIEVDVAVESVKRPPLPLSTTIDGWSYSVAIHEVGTPFGIIAFARSTSPTPLGPQLKKTLDLALMQGPNAIAGDLAHTDGDDTVAAASPRRPKRRSAEEHLLSHQRRHIPNLRSSMPLRADSSTQGREPRKRPYA